MIVHAMNHTLCFYYHDSDCSIPAGKQDFSVVSMEVEAVCLADHQGFATGRARSKFNQNLTYESHENEDILLRGFAFLIINQYMPKNGKYPDSNAGDKLCMY